MKSLYEIDKELDKFIKLRNQRLLDFPPFDRSNLTEEEITDTIILLYRVKEIIQNNTIEDAENILYKQRRDIIEKIENRYQQSDTIYNYIIVSNLTDELFGLNWVLDREKFDKAILYDKIR